MDQSERPVRHGFQSWRLGHTPVPAPLRALALTGLIDTIGVGIAGGREPTATLIPCPDQAEGARLLTGPRRADAAGAALVNGTAAHALDFDDVSGAYDGHPSAVLVTAALALAEQTHRSGQDLLDAYALGLEVASGLGATLGEWHYRRGFHATSVVGTVAAAVSCALLLRADSEQLARAVGIAASYSGGLRKNFGTMTKPYHVGLAARAGVEAARLAVAGFTADDAILEGDLGWLKVFGAAGNLVDSVAFSGERWIAVERGIAFKRYPCCYMLARPLDAALELVDSGDAPEQIQGVHADIGAGGMTALIHDFAATGLQGKFSLRYAVCAALADRTIGLATFTDRQVSRPEIQALMQRFTFTEAPSSTGAYQGAAASGSARITLTMRDGSRKSAVVTVPRGSPGAPLERSHIDAKFLDATAPAIGANSRTLLDRLWAIEKLGDVATIWNGIG